jgi:hypothetical protein
MSVIRVLPKSTFETSKEPVNINTKIGIKTKKSTPNERPTLNVTPFLKRI